MCNFVKKIVGKLYPEDLKARLEELGQTVTIEEAQAMIKIADHDGT